MASHNARCLSSSEQQCYDHFQPVYVTFLKKSEPWHLPKKQVPEAQVIQCERGCPLTLFLKDYSTKNLHVLEIHFKFIEEIVFHNQCIKSVCNVLGREGWPMWWHSVCGHVQGNAILRWFETVNLLHNVTFFAQQNWYSLCNIPVDNLAVFKQSWYENGTLRYYFKLTVKNFYRKFSGVLVMFMCPSS